MLSKNDIPKNMQELISKIGVSNNKAIGKVIYQHILFLNENYDKFDEEAKETADNIIKGVIGKIEDSINNIEEGAEKDKLLNMIQKMPKPYYLCSNKLVKILETQSDKDLDIIKDIRKIFVDKLQIILDFLTTVVETKHAGVDSFAKLSLFFLCVDELLAAFHLAQHSFVNQSYSHMRTIFESLDKIVLFNEQSEWAELWASDDPDDKKKIIWELSPASVREKLGRDRYDPLYSMFSELGPHGTFTGIQARSARKIDNESNERPKIYLWVGGCPFEHNDVWLNSFLLYSLVSVIFKIIKVYGKSLDEVEREKALSGATSDFKQFTLKYFVEWAKGENLDPQPIIETLDNLPWD